jgi:hypothetical protein
MRRAALMSPSKIVRATKLPLAKDKRWWHFSYEDANSDEVKEIMAHLWGIWGG